MISRSTGSPSGSLTVAGACCMIAFFVAMHKTARATSAGFEFVTESEIDSDRHCISRSKIA